MDVSKLIEELKDKECLIPNEELKYEDNNLYLEIKFNKIIKNPQICKKIVNLLKNKINNINFDFILSFNMNCVSFASILSSIFDKPMLLLNSDDTIMGEYDENDKIVVIKDMIFSKIELTKNVNSLNQKGFRVSHFISIFDYELFEENPDVFLENNYFSTDSDYETLLPISSFLSIPILNKIKKINHSHFLQKINNIIERKKTKIIYKTNSFNKNQIITEMQRIGHYIVGFILQVEGIPDFDINFLQRIKVLSEKMNFVLIVDKKFNDCYESTHNQYINSLYRYSEWTDMITSFPNISSIQALNDCSAQIFLLSNGNTKINFDESYLKNIPFSYIKHEKCLNAEYFKLVEEDRLEEYMIEIIKNDINLLVLDANIFSSFLPSQFEKIILKLRDIFWKCQIKVELDEKLEKILE